MKLIWKKRTKLFLIGFIFGVVLSYGVTRLSPYNFFPYLFPFRLLAPISNLLESIVLGPVCYFFGNIRVPTGSIDGTELCAGLAFDGGPLEWVEWVIMHFTVGVYYGFIFIGIQFVFEEIKKWRMDSRLRGNDKQKRP